jgi:LysM repeat protein
MMKKCTTMKQLFTAVNAVAAAVTTIGIVGIFIGNASAQAQPSQMSQAPEKPQSGEPTPVGGNVIELVKNAPDRHVVVRGDTLWDISAKFLASPWKWPSVWQMNKEQIKNPHLIYPGDVVYLDRSGASPRLRLGKQVSGGEAASVGPNKLEPLVRSEPIDKAPISTISSQAIEAFLNRPLIVEENTLLKSPRIIGGSDARLYVGRGDKVYARGFDTTAEIGSDWHIYRTAKPILDPDTKKTIAYEAIYVGAAKLERTGDPATMRVTGTQEEIGEGDRMVRAERALTFNYSPKPPDSQVTGKIVSVYKGVTQAGKNSVIAMNLGKSNGVDVGTVMKIQQVGREITDQLTKEKLRLPDESVGHVLIFRTFDKISYGLIVDVTGYPQIGDKVSNP